MNICVYGASSNIIDKYYISETERLGEAIARHGHSLVFGGGAHGVMGACARGAKNITDTSWAFLRLSSRLTAFCLKNVTSLYIPRQ